MADFLLDFIRQRTFLHMKLSELQEGQTEPTKRIDFLFASVQMPGERGRGPYIFAGWNADESPVLTVARNAREAMLGNEAFGDLDANPPVAFMYGEEVRGYTPRVLEFREIGQSVDNRDTRTRFVEDMITITGVDTNGDIQFPQIKELTLLDAILRGQITSKFNGSDSYTVCVPDDETQSLYFVLFKPPADAASNEFIYRRFLLRVIKSLVELDHHQQPPDQKGYIHVMQAVAAKLLEQQQTRNDQSMTPEKKLLIEIGLEGKEEKTAQQLIAQASVVRLRYIVELLLQSAQTTFTAGRS